MAEKEDQYRHWFLTTGTGGAVPALLTEYRHWWRSTSTGGAVPVLWWHSVQRGYSLGKAEGSGYVPVPGLSLDTSFGDELLRTYMKGCRATITSLALHLTCCLLLN
jgi:hypothetical protein